MNKHKISFEEYISYCFEYDILFLSERGKSMVRQFGAVDLVR